MSNNAHELSNRLLNALDNNYNVVDMHAVNEIISILERFNITKELLETTRLGKHVNELRRKTTDPTLARRAKVLVKRWRDLVIPTVNSPGHAGSNGSSAERQVRRLGTTPLTSPALSRQVVSPAVPSPRPPSRPAWGGYESDSQDVILVDDEPPAPSAPPAASLLANTAHKPLIPALKRPPSATPLYNEKKAKPDKKPKKKRGHSRAGSGTETTAAPGPAGTGTVSGAGTAWRERNGGAHPERRRNGCLKGPLDSYTALVHRMPPVGAKKVKTTKELLEQIQSRGSKPAASPSSPGSPASPDVMLIEPDLCPIKVDSPLRNGGASPRPTAPLAPPPPPPPLEDEREYRDCTCGEVAEAACPAAAAARVLPLHVRALHAAYLPGVNGTRAPPHPHRFAVRAAADAAQPGLFASVVPLYKYSDYADDYCVKNMDRVPLCARLPWTEFAPSPPDPPPPPSPPPIRPYPIDEPASPGDGKSDEPSERDSIAATQSRCAKVESEPLDVPVVEPSERLGAPSPPADDEPRVVKSEIAVKMEVEEQFATKQQDHRTVERTKESIETEESTGRTLYEACRRTIEAIPYDYLQMSSTPVLTLPEAEAEAREALHEALARSEADSTRDALDRPPRAADFTEWHECAKLGELVALPYVVID